MGIQINGQTDRISAVDGTMTFPGTVTYEDVSRINVVGVVTASSFNSTTGNVVITENANVMFQNSARDTNRGAIQFTDGGDFRLRSGGALSESLRVSAGGSFGITNSDPSYKISAKDTRADGTGVQLHLWNNSVDNTAGNVWSGIRFTGSTSDYQTAEIKGWRVHPGTGLNSLSINTGGVERMVLSSSGVGIGTDSPRGKLEVSDGTSNTAGEAINEAYIVGATTGSSEGILTIQSNDAMASDKGGSIAFGGRAITSSTAGANWAFINGYKENGTTANYGGYLSFATRPNSGSISEAMRIDSSGSLLVNTTSSPTGAISPKVVVNGNTLTKAGSATIDNTFTSITGATVGNETSVYLVTIRAIGDGNFYSTGTFILNSGAYSKTFTQLGTASNHFGNGSISAQLSSYSTTSASIQVRRSNAGSATCHVHMLRLM